AGGPPRRPCAVAPCRWSTAATAQACAPVSRCRRTSSSTAGPEAPADTCPNRSRNLYCSTARADESPVRIIGDLAIDIAAREVRVAGLAADLTTIEIELLDALTAQPNVVLTRAQLIEAVWGPYWYGDEHVVDVHLSNLRKKLGDDAKAPRYVVTVRGVGFKLAA